MTNGKKMGEMGNLGDKHLAALSVAPQIV